jgi:hypothetical protein
MRAVGGLQHLSGSFVEENELYHYWESNNKSLVVQGMPQSLYQLHYAVSDI